MTRTNPYWLALFLPGLLMASGTAVAQSDAYIISQQAFVNVMPLYQRWSVGDDMTFSQLGVAVSAYAPLSRELSVGAHTAHTKTDGDVTSLSGLSDARLSLNYYMEKPGLVLSCGLTLPTGKKELTQDEFETSLLITSEVFDLQIPNVGQGFMLQPGLAWAASPGSRVSVGAGASYQYRAAYKPLADYGDYDPGDEVLLTAGADFRVGETSTLAVDMIFTMYGEDRLDGNEVFAAGSKVSVNARFGTYVGLHEILLSARYRTRSASEIGVAGTMVAETEKALPDLFELSGRFDLYVNQQFSVGLLAGGRFFQKASGTYSDARIMSVGVAPAFVVSSGITIPARVRLQFGKLGNDDSMQGLEIGAGIAVSL